MATWARTAKILGRASRLTSQGSNYACRQSDTLTHVAYPSSLQQMRSMASGVTRLCTKEVTGANVLGFRS